MLYIRYLIILNGHDIRKKKVDRLLPLELELLLVL